MKKLVIAGIMSFLMLGTGMSTWAGDRFEYRQQRQLKDIHRGLRTGQITDREFKRLSKEQERIREFRKEAKAKGYNFKTRNFLETMQKRADVNIYSARHNGRTIYNTGFNRGRISGVPAYGTTLPYGRNYRSGRNCNPRAVNLPSRSAGGIYGGYRGSRSGVRASVRW